MTAVIVAVVMFVEKTTSFSQRLCRTSHPWENMVMDKHHNDDTSDG